MSNFFTRIYSRLRHRWCYGLISVFVAVGIIISNPSPGAAVPPWANLLFRGLQVLQLSTLSDNQEVAIGRQINEQLVGQEVNLYPGGDIREYVDQIGQRLVPYSERPDIPYVFQVIDDNQINAFATMGGYVYVTTQLIKTADNEAQLASVLAHEIGHIAERHSVEQMREGALAQGVMTAAGVDRNAAVNIGVELALRRPHSRQDELEADQLGLINLQQAGYAPGAMAAFMKKLLDQPSMPSFLSTHPAVPDRIRALNQAVDPAIANRGDGLDTAAYRARVNTLS